MICNIANQLQFSYTVFLVLQIKQYEAKIQDLVNQNNELINQLRGMKAALPSSDVAAFPLELATMESSTLEPLNVYNSSPSSSI